MLSVITFFFNDTATTEIYTLSLHDALPIYNPRYPAGEFVEVLNEHQRAGRIRVFGASNWSLERIEEANRSEEHTSELQSRQYLVCRLLLEKKKIINNKNALPEYTPLSHITA